MLKIERNYTEKSCVIYGGQISNDELQKFTNQIFCAGYWRTDLLRHPFTGYLLAKTHLPFATKQLEFLSKDGELFEKEKQKFVHLDPSKYDDLWSLDHLKWLLLKNPTLKDHLLSTDRSNKN